MQRISRSLAPRGRSDTEFLPVHPEIRMLEVDQMYWLLPNLDLSWQGEKATNPQYDLQSEAARRNTRTHVW